MAGLAGRGKAFVGHGTGRSVEVIHVARDAGRAGEVVIVVAMAIRTLPWGYGVSVAEREAHAGVIELCAEPVIRAVALITTGSKLPRHVIWVGRAFEIRRVT